MEKGDQNTDLSTESIFRLDRIQRQLRDGADNRKRRRARHHEKRKNKEKNQQDQNYILTGKTAPSEIPPIFTLKNLGWVLFSLIVTAWSLNGTLLGPDGFYQTLDSTDDLKDFGPMGAYLMVISGLILFGIGTAALLAMAIFDLERVNRHARSQGYVINLWEDHLPILICAIIASVILGLWATAMMYSNALSTILTLWLVFFTSLVFTILVAIQFFGAASHNRKARSK